MFDYFICAIIAGVFLFITFFDEIKYLVLSYLSNKDKRNKKILATERIAKVKLLSISSKEIEEFIRDNAEVLSEEMVALLITRLENILTDEALKHNDLKNKIDNLSNKSGKVKK